MKRRTPESLVLHAILDYLAAERVLAFRMQTGVAEIEGRRVVFGTPGMADILAFQECNGGFAHDPADHSNPLTFTIPRFDITPLWIECKAENGKQSELQKSFQAQVTQHGHDYLIARSIDDVRTALEALRG
jgi:hypothetical protein